MNRRTIFVMVFLSAFSFNGLVFANDHSFGEPSAGDVIRDVLCIRPLGFIELAFNSLFFAVSLPITIPLKKTNEAEQFLIKDPYNFYFNRGLGAPLGEI